MSSFVHYAVLSKNTNVVYYKNKKNKEKIMRINCNTPLRNFIKGGTGCICDGRKYVGLKVAYPMNWRCAEL